ncbi:hypothetical protein TWF696_007198 [Orbilia brochopaga]|uniref:Uncharacterized protein n=1 Tax=Orbilia brochopaga TaxID=3140254 RepID=A0AAV9URY1_9PEZI
MKAFYRMNEARPELLLLSPNEEVPRQINIWLGELVGGLLEDIRDPQPDARQVVAQHYLDVMMACLAISQRLHERLAYCWRQKNPPIEGSVLGTNPFDRLLEWSPVPEMTCMPLDLGVEDQADFDRRMDECANYTEFPLKYEGGRFLYRPSVRAGFERYELLLDEPRKLELLALMGVSASPAKRSREEEEEAVSGEQPSPKRLRTEAPPDGEAVSGGDGHPSPAANRSAKRKGGEQGGRQPKRPKSVAPSDRQLRPRKPKQPAQNL